MRISYYLEKLSFYSLTGGCSFTGALTLTEAGRGGLQPVQGGRGNFRLLAQSQAEEDAFDYVRHRGIAKPSGVFGSIAHIVKGSLGGGILGGHVAYSKGGAYFSVPANLFFGVYMCYCLYLLVSSAQILYRRTRVPSMSYPDVGEAAVACFPNPRVAKFSRAFRHTIDTIICIDLFGACACYQLIIAKTVKQLVEDSQETAIHALLPNYPNLRVYLAAIIIPIVLICLITTLKWLAPFSIVANFVVLTALIMTVYYAAENNPTLTGMKTIGSFYETLQFTGMIVFSMSCAGVVIPIENSMGKPNKFPIVLLSGMTIVVIGTIVTSFFGYAGFLERSEAPITVNFPMTTGPKVLKGLIALMIYVTHALNYWPPFNICFTYLRMCHKSHHFLWELVYRALIVVAIATVAIIFPSINALMGFLGTFCLSNMAFIWPALINLLVIWHRPGLGKYKWRLWRALVLIGMGIFILICGGIANIAALVMVLFGSAN